MRIRGILGGPHPRGNTAASAQAAGADAERAGRTGAHLDPAHRILGGFSNGAHMTAGLLDDFDGEESSARRVGVLLLLCVRGAPAGADR